MRHPRIRRRRLLHPLLALLLAALPACSDDDSPGNNNTADASVDAAQDAGPSGESFSVRVIDLDQTTEETVVPVEGATVAFDAPGGERTELTTGADGRVTFEGIDWSLGAGTLQAYKPDMQLATVLGVDATSLAEATAMSDTGDWELGLGAVIADAAPVTFVEVTGSATHLQNPARDYLVHPLSTQVESAWSGPGTDSYAVRIQADAPATLLGAELTGVNLPSGLGYELDIRQAMLRDLDPLTADASLDLDFQAYSVPLHTADASVLRGYRADSPWNDLALQVFNFADDTGWAFGWAAHTDVSADESAFDVTHVWCEPPGVVNPYTLLQHVQGNWEQYSVLVLGGYPEGGTHARLLDAPEWISPANVSMAHPLRGEFEFEAFDDTWSKRLNLFRNLSGAYRLVHVVGIITDERRVKFTIPAPPSTVDEGQLYGTSALYGQLFLGNPNEEFTRWVRYVVPNLILVAP